MDNFLDGSDGILDVAHHFPVIQSYKSDTIAFQSLLPFFVFLL